MERGIKNNKHGHFSAKEETTKQNVQFVIHQMNN